MLIVFSQDVLPFKCFKNVVSNNKLNDNIQHVGNYVDEAFSSQGRKGHVSCHHGWKFDIMPCLCS